MKITQETLDKVQELVEEENNYNNDYQRVFWAFARYMQNQDLNTRAREICIKEMPSHKESFSSGKLDDTPIMRAVRKALEQ